MRTDMDMLIMENLILNKTEQPHFDDDDRWKEKYGLD
jgi:hypothetical protein